MAPFRNRTFRSLWLSALLSNFGGLVQAVGAAWMMASLTRSESMVALVQSSVTLPLMIFSLFAGIFADSFDRRRVMLVAQSFMLVVSVALAAMAWMQLLTPWLLLAFTFLVGCGAALHNPSWQASMGDIVERDDLPAAVALNSMGFNLMRSVGPAIGGAIVATAGAAAAFAVNAVSYLALIGALLRWRRPEVAAGLPREPFGLALPGGASLRGDVAEPPAGDPARHGLRFFGGGDPRAAAGGGARSARGRRSALRGAAGMFRARGRGRRDGQRTPALAPAERGCREAGVLRDRDQRGGTSRSAATRRRARRSFCWPARAGSRPCRSSTSRCSSPRRAGWSGARWRSSRPGCSAAWRRGVGSGDSRRRASGRIGR